MDRFFPEKILGEIYWDNEPLISNSETNQSDIAQYCYSSQDDMKGEGLGELFPPAAKQSAFVQYRDPAIPMRRTRTEFGEEISPSPSASHSQSMSKRMIAFLRKGCPVERHKAAEHERERCFRHMISERMRRQRQRHCCLALHSMLPHGTKTDNNSVIQMAAKEIQRLQACREELRRKNLKLEATLEEVESVEMMSSQVGGSKLRHLRVPCPTSGINSMVETLKCLKGHGVDTRTIKSSFSHEELFAVLEFESIGMIADAEVEKAIQRTLDEVERKLHLQVREGSKQQRLDYV